MWSRIIVTAFGVLLSCAEYLPAQAGLQPDYRPFVRKAKQFIDYGQDFLDFAKNGDFQASSDLAAIASTANSHASAASTLLQVYNDLSCPQDKGMLRTVIRREFSYYSKEVALEIKEAQLDISVTEKPGVAAEALRMKDDLRELQSLFDSVTFP